MVNTTHPPMAPSARRTTGPHWPSLSRKFLRLAADHEIPERAALNLWPHVIGLIEDAYNLGRRHTADQKTGA